MQVEGSELFHALCLLIEDSNKQSIRGIRNYNPDQLQDVLVCIRNLKENQTDDFFNEDALRRFILNLWEDHYTGVESVTDMAAILEDRITNRKYSVYDVFLPISGVVITKNLKVGALEFMTSDEWRQNFAKLCKQFDIKETEKEFFDDSLQVPVIKIQVSAFYLKEAITIAISSAQVIVNYLTVKTGNIRKSSYLFQVNTITEIQHLYALAIGHYDGYHRVDQPQKQLLPYKDFVKTITQTDSLLKSLKLISKKIANRTPLTKSEVNLRTALDKQATAYLDMDNQQKITLLIAGMEALLEQPPREVREGIGNQLVHGIVMLLEKHQTHAELEDLNTIEENINELYNIRSRILHGDNVYVFKSGLQILDRYLTAIIDEVADNFNKFNTDEGVASAVKVLRDTKKD
ncbi:hypothetical protein [Periweissella fabalis]|uniref:Apea-like HEPN domain-containing protein n=1 Tax=Periweissella fabalis TaxID=1070421 RepID=A0A7X6N1S3_9LACO|nr:hypothetical protein [Periweissella fabalis]MCM0599385.1 hypothetical protein [Periweissella fabalis]NKZ23664.1 hypothetical protein [Periweissella fabalis]